MRYMNPKQKQKTVKKSNVLNLKLKTQLQGTKLQFPLSTNPQTFAVCSNDAD